MLLALLMLASLQGVAAGVDARTDAALADCDAAPLSRTLTAIRWSPAASRAHWLDADTLQWPGAHGSGRYALYHAADATLVAEEGAAVTGADGRIALDMFAGALPEALASRFKFVAGGVVLRVPTAVRARVQTLLRQQLVLVQEDVSGKVRAATGLQIAGALDALYAVAAEAEDFGVGVDEVRTRFQLWAPTARDVSVCVHEGGKGPALARYAMRFDDRTGTWSSSRNENLTSLYYTYLIDVFVPGIGLVRNRVTDPYAISLTTDSKRSYIADLDDPSLEPAGWEASRAPDKVAAQTDMVIYELHVRDFSIGDETVSAANRGKYLAFTEDSNGMRHLQALSDAGLTDVHLLPVFDLATVPESGCVTPAVPDAAPDSTSQQAAVMAAAARDCFNWGYDPFHFNAPEGSYASDAADGATRIHEFRAMVMALHAAGLRVGMDVVYNHTSASGQHPHSVLDRIVPGYYHRLDADGAVTRSTCCDNTATEHAMMAKLMIDSTVLWARHYRIDSFRFDLMGHQPRAAMERLREQVNAATGRDVHLIGEGWNFGEVADGARFVQASQLSLNGSGIGTFSDRARDAIRGGGPADAGDTLSAEQGYVNGLVHDRNRFAPQHPAADLLQAADMIRVGLAGTLRDYRMIAYTDAEAPLHKIDYKGQPAGYASQPSEVVNYAENHDNQTLFDINVWKLPQDTSREDRARVQVLAMALTTFSQGVAYFHAGIDTLRSKSLDRNSYDSGDWFNRLDWTYRDNFFGTGLPPEQDNGKDWAGMRPLLSDAAIKPTPREIAFTRDAFRDLLRIRTSTSLFRLRSADEVSQRLRFHNTGSTQNPLVIVGHLDGDGAIHAHFRELLYFVNVGKTAQTLTLADEAGKTWRLHPVHRSADAADTRPTSTARYDTATGRFTLPARTALVYIVE